MSLYLLSSRLSPPLLNFSPYSSTSILYFFLNNPISANITPVLTIKTKRWLSYAGNDLFRINASPNESHGSRTTSSPAELLDEDLLSRVSAAKDAAEALDIISNSTDCVSGTVSASDCCSIISAAIERGNADLAVSIFSAMRTSFDSGIPSIERWKWSRPNVNCYSLLIRGLASLLRVSDALRIIATVCRTGASSAEEVPFGKVVRCPCCMIAIAVSQPQHGTQVVSCSKCRYQYELVSGSILSIESEEIRISYCRTQHEHSSMEENAKIYANCEAEHSSCCPLHCGGNPFWNGTDIQVCY